MAAASEIERLQRAARRLADAVGRLEGALDASEAVGSGGEESWEELRGLAVAAAGRLDEAAARIDTVLKA